MGIETTSSTDIFIETDSVDGDKLVIRYKDGSKWFKLTCDSSGDLIITDNDGNVVTLTTSTGTLTPSA